MASQQQMFTIQEVLDKMDVGKPSSQPTVLPTVPAPAHRSLVPYDPGAALPVHDSDSDDDFFAKRLKDHVQDTLHTTFANKPYISDSAHNSKVF